MLVYSYPQIRLAGGVHPNFVVFGILVVLFLEIPCPKNGFKKMRKTRSDTKPIGLPLAIKLYWEGGSLVQVSKVFNVHHTNLMMRFRRFRVPTKTKSEALKGNPLIVGPRGNARYSLDQKGYLVNNQTHIRKHRELAEQVLGRGLKTDEVVHHWDGNGQNNEHSNLIICSKAYHSWLHAKIYNGLIGKNFQKEI